MHASSEGNTYTVSSLPGFEKFFELSIHKTGTFSHFRLLVLNGNLNPTSSSKITFYMPVTLFFFSAFVKNRILGLSLVIYLSNNNKKKWRNKFSGSLWRKVSLCKNQLRIFQVKLKTQELWTAARFEFENYWL